MNKRDLIAKATQRFGKWAGTKPIVYLPIETADDIKYRRNHMAQGNYPLSMTDCEVVGINGDCGDKCPVFLAGNCKEH